jgi:hypothetical protein
MAIHHITFLGIRRAYSVVMTRCSPCTVRAKSGTSLEREMSRMMAMALEEEVSWR